MKTGTRRAVAVLAAVLGMCGLSFIASGPAGASTRVAPPMERAGTGNGVQTSLDWAGYADTGTTFSSVAGSWVQPASVCPVAKAEQAAFWVGLDGYAANDPTVEQIGTDSDCTKQKGSKVGVSSYYAWYELFPKAVVILPSSLYPVSPADVMSASVTVSGPSYVLSISDGSKWHFTTTQTPTSAPQNSSAEWIAEAPSLCKSNCKVLKLADFTGVSFFGASANGQAISSAAFTNHQINMTTKNVKKAKALTSALLGGGTAFSVNWVHT